MLQRLSHYRLEPVPARNGQIGTGTSVEPTDRNHTRRGTNRLEPVPARVQPGSGARYCRVLGTRIW